MSLAHAYPRWEGDVAGAFIERLVMALQRRSHHVSMIVPGDSGVGGSVIQNGVTVRRVRYAPASLEMLAYRGHMTQALKSATGMACFAALLAGQTGAAIQASTDQPANLIHAHWWVPGGVAGWLAHLVVHRPYIVTLHGTDVTLLERSRIARALASTVLRKAGAVTVVSSFLAQRVAELLQDSPARFLVQPMPLDIGRYSRLSQGGGGVVTVGRLVAQKRIGTLLEAIARLRSTGSELALRIIGDGPERRSLEYYATRLGIADATEFVGEVRPEAIPDAIGNADVFAFPAAGEGFGLAAAEALMLGVPVVASRGGGVSEFVPPEGAGRLVDSDSAGELAVAIAALVDDPQSRPRAAELGGKLRARFEPDRVAAVFEAVYDQVLRGAV
ncbi:MAG: glycosyltransferase [Gemmatimonadota bacterium]|nr:MAG: glycosyltransferase [Gemmatimonadota bacterium]